MVSPYWFPYWSCPHIGPILVLIGMVSPYCSPYWPQPEATSGNHLPFLRGRHGDRRHHALPPKPASPSGLHRQGCRGAGYVNGIRQSGNLATAGFHRHRTLAPKKHQKTADNSAIFQQNPLQRSFCHLFCSSR